MKTLVLKATNCARCMHMQAIWFLSVRVLFPLWVSNPLRTYILGQCEIRSKSAKMVTCDVASAMCQFSEPHRLLLCSLPRLVLAPEEMAPDYRL